MRLRGAALALWALLLAVALAACGRPGSDPPPGPSSNWNELVWDQDDWA